MGRALSSAGASANLRCSGTACFEFGVICPSKLSRRKIVFVAEAGMVTTKGLNALWPRRSSLAIAD
jgi:hypothetical protein